MVQDHEDIIIPPPLEFRDGWKSTPLPKTKKMIMPVPVARTEVEEKSKAHKGSYQIICNWCGRR